MTEKIPRARRAIGYAAVVATLPYLFLKLDWVLGGTIGIIDRQRATDSGLLAANLATMGMDALAVLIALAFTQRWGLRLPSWLVLFPMWVATGFLAPIVAIIPSAPFAAADTVAKDPDPFLRSWVYVLVYGGFAVQGVLLVAAFVLYARHRWAAALRASVSAARPGPAHLVQTLLAVVVPAMAVVVAAVHLAWAAGATVGLPADLAAQRPLGHYVTNAAYGVFALAAAAGLPMLVHRLPRRGPGRVPLLLTWLGGGSMFTWGCWTLITMGHAHPDARLGSGDVTLFVLATQLEVLTGALVGVAGAYLLAERFSPDRWLVTGAGDVAGPGLSPN
ncbi:hypothetical protein QMK19_33010 [Streptomyces sp. H10-C2]|uniref:hypothetical protein n=1 Tax=unclassified Streptomyces TaxID=2593676 RepID=UPI0024BA0B17|nr:MULTISPECIES: hypothetical protein [unclassified Streptomyces]MDJ0346929.1 hypothetical protein [Streptomyces sp. PH10-H1]MDJ0374327.1 hypothetical protein [Streptomyces sp. H10-C2]